MKKSYLVCQDCYDYFRLEGDATFLDYHYSPDKADQRLKGIQEGEKELVSRLPGFTPITVHDRDDEFKGGPCECCGCNYRTLLQVFAHYSLKPIDRADTATTDDPEFRAAYDDCLNEIYGTVTIASIEYSTAQALRDVDPVAYNEGFRSWLNSLAPEDYPGGGRWQCPVCETNYEDKESAEECLEACGEGEIA